MQQDPNSSAKVTTVLGEGILSPPPVSQELMRGSSLLWQLSAINTLSSGGLSFLLGWPSILMTGDSWPDFSPFDLSHSRMRRLDKRPAGFPGAPLFTVAVPRWGRKHYIDWTG